MSTHKPRYRRLTAWLASLLVLLVIAAACVPPAIKWGVEYGLARLGADQVAVAKVNFNPFRGRLELRGLRAGVAGEKPLALERVSVDIAWWLLWSRRLVLESLEVEGLQLAVVQAEDGGLRFSGLAMPAAESAAAPAATEPEQPGWGFGVRQLRLANSTVDYQGQGLALALQVDALELHTLYTQAVAMPTNATLQGKLNGAPLTISLRGTPLSTPRYLQGSVQLQALPLADFNAVIPPAIAALKGRLDLDLTLDARLAGGDDFQLDTRERITLSDLEFRMPEQGLGIRHQRLSWQGTLGLGQAAGQSHWAVAGDIASQQSQVMQQGGEEQPPLFSVASATISGLRVNQRPELAIDSIHLDSTRLRLTRGKDGAMQLPGAKATAAPQAERTVTPPEERAEASAPLLRLKQLRISGDSGVQFEDRSVSPPYKLNLQLGEVQLDDIDTAHPDQPSALKVSGKLDEYSSFSLGGTLYPFSDKLTLDLAGNIKSLDLPPLSSYTAAALGYNLTSGHLDAELAFKVEQGVISSENQLKINKLTLDPSDQEKVAKFSKRLSMPLDAALSLLRDKQDNIQLKLPISGDVENPEFDIADAINQSLASAMRFAAMYYVKLALQPFGALVSIYQVADSAGKMVSSVRLDPVYFVAGEAVLDETATDYLATTIKLLQSRPQLNLRICGKAIVPELAALQAKQEQQRRGKKTQQETAELSAEDSALLLELARARSVAVKNYLVTEGGIDAGRLFVCNPELDQAEAATSRVELLI